MVGTSIYNLIKVFDLINEFVFVKAVRGPCTFFGQSSFKSRYNKDRIYTELAQLDF
jgi:hypothetical protein